MNSTVPPQHVQHRRKFYVLNESCLKTCENCVTSHCCVISRKPKIFAQAKNMPSFFSSQHALHQVLNGWSTMLENIPPNFVRQLATTRAFWHKPEKIFSRRNFHFTASFQSKYSFLKMRMHSIIIDIFSRFLTVG